MDAAAHGEAPPPAVVLVSAGASHSVALLAGNVLCTWGRGEDGQLGHGDAEDRLVPTVISGFDAPGITSVICGSDHTTAYSEEEQQVYSWGWGDFGRLGHGNSSDVFTPQPVKALQGIPLFILIFCYMFVLVGGVTKMVSSVLELLKIRCSHKRYKLLSENIGMGRQRGCGSDDTDKAMWR